MKTWTEEELDELSRVELRNIIKELAKEKNCQARDIVPFSSLGQKDILVSSILEAQEEARGQ